MIFSLITMGVEANNNILIIGRPNSGKTTFYGQLYGRMELKKGVIRLLRAPRNLKAIHSAYERLASGLEPLATPSNEDLEIIIPVKWEEEELDLVFKDYGGEQVKRITDLLEYDKTWQIRAKENDRWILFIRPSQIYHHYDITITGYASIDTKTGSNELHNELSDQYVYIELIQALLHARGTGIKSDLDIPKLMIVFTCWDELKTDLNPREILKQKLPLFQQFIDTLWSAESVAIMGLSAQEFNLNSEEARDKYLDYLPESFGYIVYESNEQDKDLTKLIEASLKL